MVPRIAILCLVVVTASTLAHGQGIPGTPPGQVELTNVQKLERAHELKEAALEENEPEFLREALDLVSDVLEEDTLNTEARLLAGEILMEANEYDSARDNFSVVLEVEPSNFRANLGVGKIWNANRSWRQATAYLERAERVAADLERAVEVKRALAIAYAGQGKLTEAIQKMDEVVRADPDDLDGLQTSVGIRLGAAARDPKYLEGEEGALAAAETYLKKVTQVVQQTPWKKEELDRLNQAYELLLAALRTLHNTFYEHDIRNQPTDKLLPGKEVQAAAALNRIAEKLSEHALLKLTLAEHEALMLAEKAVEYDPWNVKYLENLAALYQRTKNRARAVETFRKILELDPQHPGAKQYLEAVGEPLSAPSPVDTTSPPGE
ncbi:MAG: tetratricopeptide repeat protein [Phycisphaerae bacterium]|nr:tetratricopeptide repeat protein [Phycisphaerae bacterium]